MILGIDYGLVHIGLATSQGNFATPVETLMVKSPSQAIKEISLKVKLWGIDQVVIGISEGKSKNRAIGFGKKLETVLRLKVNFVDETLSSAQAKPAKREEKEREHSRAAAIILQRWLDNKSTYA